MAVAGVQGGGEQVTSPEIQGTERCKRYGEVIGAEVDGDLSLLVGERWGNWERERV
jgi:hypothetical protein